MKRHHAGLRRERRRVRRRTDAEFDIACFDQLQNLRLLPELGAGILVDQHRPTAQFLELVGEKIARDAISSGFWLIIGKAIMPYLLRRCGADPSGGEDPKRNPVYRITDSRHLTLRYSNLSMCNICYHQPTMLVVPRNAPVYGRPEYPAGKRLTRKPAPLLA